MFSRIRSFFFGAPMNPMNPKTRERISLIALMALVGLGADALSSSCYGPEEAYVALGSHVHLALFVALFTVITVFVISFGYNQVIELFPSGGGGYKVASKLLHPYAGLLAGSALIVDYVLTIAVSVASGTDAIFSFLPLWTLAYKLYFATGLIFLLLFFNMRGMKEAIQVLIPIFFGFIVSHVLLIVYGIAAHSTGLLYVVPDTLKETHLLAQSVGWFGVMGLTLHAYSLGSGTYTGLEAVSNNANHLAEPRVKTGKRTMLYMAISLSFMAGGIILLYLLWGVQPVPGKTLNATVFQLILGNTWLGQSTLVLVLELEAGLLLVAANAGFAAGPSVLANMAVDNWMPNRFRHLSSRLTVQNGLILYGIAALVVLYITDGKVSMLVVLYSINVFITFSFSLLGVSVYWYKHRASSIWKWHFAFSLFACFVTTTILCITIYYKFMSGGWVTLLITSAVVIIGLLVRHHYQHVEKKLKDMDALLAKPLSGAMVSPVAIDPQLPTAIVFINTRSVGMHTLLSILRIFPNQFSNFVFVGVGAVDAESYSGQQELEAMQTHVNQMLDYFVQYCREYHMVAEAYSAFGTDPVTELKRLADIVCKKYPRGIFFSSRLVFSHENMVTWFLHNHTPQILQDYLHFQGRELMILPMKL